MTNVDTVVSVLSKTEKEKIFNEVFYPLADDVLNYAFYLCKDRTLADDILQDGMVKAYENIDKFRLGSNAKAWLFTIVRNHYYNMFRKKKTKPTKVSIENTIGGTDNFGHVLDLRDEFFGNLYSDEVETAIKNLEDKYRDILLLSDVEEFSYKELSEILDIAEGTVRSRLFRARNLMKTALLEYGKTQGYKDKRRKLSK